MLTPALALIAWTLIVWLLLYATRLPAMRRHKIHPSEGRHARDIGAKLPSSVRQIGDNYNHLHEQPTIFYALAFYIHLVEQGDALNVSLAWSYVVSRVAHSLVQCTFNHVPTRFAVFALGSIILAVLTVRAVWALI